MDHIWPKNQIKLENAWKFVTLNRLKLETRSCGGALGGWRVGDQAYQAHLSSSFVCYDLHDGLLEADQR
ncbi:hypothetical protein Taro_052157 [Colocasia esculenta]|uniref:Uncharacterized protein n=1 Tax=Colocasia esculenta TaxID=4460 RepID=A0A843XJD9_COLES|nr:hypothetical protein [Colocasia esculenta]